VSDLIPDNLPYRRFPREWIDEPPTWYEYITGQFDGEMWYKRDEIDKEYLDSLGYEKFSFDEGHTYLHKKFLKRVGKSRMRPGMYEPGSLAIEMKHRSEPCFHSDTQCRFDIWTLYNQGEEVELDIGGTVRIATLPQQEDINNVPSLRDPIPSDVPLIFGPRRYTPVGEPKAPHRPFVRNNPQISNFTTMESRLQEQHHQFLEKKKRQQRQFAQCQKEKRQKWEKAQRQKKKRQQRQRAQDKRDRRKKDQRSRHRASRGRRAPSAF
jgi:hypothetical protein